MAADQHRTQEKPIAAFVLALLGGLWMLVAGVGMYGGMGRGMHGWPDHGGRWSGGWMHSRGLVCNFAPDYWWPWLGALLGVLVIVGAASLFARPALRVGWGITIIVAATIGFIMGTGGLLAAVLAVIGGILALTWQPKDHASTQTKSSA